MSEKERMKRLAEEMEKLAEIEKISEGVARKVKRYFNNRPKDAPRAVYPSDSQVKDYVVKRRSELISSSPSYIMSKTAEEIIRNIEKNGRFVLKG